MFVRLTNIRALILRNTERKSALRDSVLNLLFDWIFTLSQVRLLSSFRKRYVVEINLALLHHIFLYFPAMSFKCGIVLLMLVGGIVYCKYQNTRWRARTARMSRFTKARTLHIQPRTQPRALKRHSLTHAPT